MLPANAAYTAHNIPYAQRRKLLQTSAQAGRAIAVCAALVRPQLTGNLLTEEQHASLSKLLQPPSAACCEGGPGTSGLELRTERRMVPPIVSEVLRIDDFIVDGEG